MASPSRHLHHVMPWTDPQFIDGVAQYTMQTYYRSEEPGASPTTGFCIPITPQSRLSDSPTGGIIGRYLAKSTGYPSSLTASSTSSEEDSKASDSNVASWYHINIESPPQALVQEDHHNASWRQRFSPKFRAGSQPGEIKLQKPSESPSPQAGNASFASLAPTSTISAIKQPSQGSVGQKPLDPADMDFLFKKLDHQLSASNNQPLMTRLIPVHQGRPGQHILRSHEQTGQLYACIPSNPYAPQAKVGQQEYSLPSYDSYMQSKANGDHRAQNPYPASGVSSLTSCNHCLSPTKVLNNESLCPFHAYYLATGRFLGYYEFCALVELEKHSMSILTGWWTIEDLVKFADALTERIHKWRLIEDSTPIPKGSWTSKASPFGPIGGEVPQRAKGRTALHFGAVQKLSKAIHTAVDRQTNYMMAELELDEVPGMVRQAIHV